MNAGRSSLLNLSQPSRPVKSARSAREEPPATLNSLSNGAQTALMIGAMLATSLGMVMLYEAYKESQKPPPDKMPQFGQSPQVYWTSAPYGVDTTQLQDV